MVRGMLGMHQATQRENDLHRNHKIFQIRWIMIFLTCVFGLSGASCALAQDAPGYLGGSRASGRVAEVYVKSGDKLFLALRQAPQHLRKNAELWIDVEFSDSRANDIASARAVLNPRQAGVEVGDVVEIQFAHKDNRRFFPLQELTRVTALVARKDDLRALDYERRILACMREDASPAFEQMHARAHTSSPSFAPGAAAAGSGR